ncbi:MAG: hypothetical protein AB7N76_24500 [Planctomycetota bacterium]
MSAAEEERDPPSDLELFCAFVEWPQVRARIAAHTDSAAGREAARALLPALDQDGVAALQEATGEAQALLARAALCDLSGTADLPLTFTRAREQDRALDSRELRSIVSTVRAAERAREAYLRSPRLATLVAAPDEASASGLPALAATIEAAVGPYGEVLDEASETLAGVRRRLAGQRAQLEDELRRLVTDGSVMLAVVEHRPVRRDGQPCLLIKQEELRRVPGPIIAQEPGRYYVQPDALATGYNALRDLTVAEQREELRLVEELSAAAHAWESALRELALGLIQADLHQAMARYALALECVPAEASPDAGLLLAGARHPLLAEREACVPLDLELPSDRRLLLISGPNGGGKTAAMKTVALLALLAQTGCPVPARRARLPVYRAFVSVADARSSVGEGVSTFQAHARDLRRALDGARPGALVLLDEIGVGTDPGEAAALAQAILEHLMARPLRLLATTHLAPLKAFAAAAPAAQTAAVALDAEGRPTFSLHLGRTGGSFALEVARQAGLPEAVVARAAALHAGEPPARGDP